MNYLLLFPFAYFYTTRIREGSLVFHVLFEWMAAALVVVLVGASILAVDMVGALLSYCAFISLYELGYMMNDLHASQKEAGGRRRGPQEASRLWIALWVLARISAFLVSTIAFDQWNNPGWWLFFAAIAAVFSLHNWLQDREMKVSTFAWLAWFRFMAPLVFVVEDSQRMGVGLAAAMGYMAFRQLGYMDSKGLLRMPGRQKPGFRRFFFLTPLAGAAALLPYAEAHGFIALCVYWGAVATAGTLVFEQGSRE